jgi:hypothetical protein
MNKLFRPLFALLLLIPVALILVLQTVAAPQADEDQGIERRRRLLEQQAERLERAVENAVESDDPEAIQVRRNLHNQLKAIHLKLDELALFSDDNRERDEERRRRGDDDEDRERDEERRRRGDDDDGRERDEERRRRGDDDDGRERDEERRRRGDDDDDHDNRERGKHLSAALEHLQAAGLSREVARHVIGEVLRIQESHKHQERDHRREDHRREDQREREHGEHEHDEHEHEDDERRRDDGDDEDDDKFHYRAHHETATQLEALRREVEELRQLIKRMAARR